MQSNLPLSVLRGQILRDSTFLSLSGGENEIKPGDLDVTSVNYGRHIFCELPVSFLKLGWGKEMKNLGKGFCKEVYI